ncbi:MAG: hypothetical protein DVB23_001676 [Verrucomicrobia bacterium]|nr:MAG: hypothetical protein DVB23_001676 [Verrucomicrobiota bacterium]
MRASAIKNCATCLSISVSLALTALVQATPSGLNNIPTADTVPHRTIAIQGFSSFGDGANQFSANGPGQHAYWMGFKTGWDFTSFHLEWGLDSPIAPGDCGPLLFQTKVGFSPWDDGTVALGVANVAFIDTDRASDPFSYAILAQDLGILRVHTGYGIQTHGNTMLLGLDRTWKVFDRDFNLNADLVQAANQSFWLPAMGAKYFLNKHFVLETWANFPSQGQSSFIAKFNYVVTF